MNEDDFDDDLTLMKSSVVSNDDETKDDDWIIVDVDRIIPEIETSDEVCWMWVEYLTSSDEITVENVWLVTTLLTLSRDVWLTLVTDIELFGYEKNWDEVVKYVDKNSVELCTFNDDVICVCVDGEIAMLVFVAMSAGTLDVETVCFEYSAV